ncbi:hypothetical protein LEP1GSC100_1505 [Leptospira interrogans serovar Bataviae str. UI 08561]|nr:hypothetical protein LEP1GSC100_1505 [Leptospira interrogans serovar Bataviae str. UI 08561]
MSRTYQLITSSGIFVLIILFPLSLTASTIVLKNGRTLQGKIINQSRTEVQIEVNGKLQTISKAEISEINLKDPKKEESKKKEVITTRPPDHTNPTTTQLSWQDTRWAITGRSAILPGWGQWKVGQKRWAIISFYFLQARLYTLIIVRKKP